MSKLAKFKLTRTEKKGLTYWGLFVPGYLLPDGKAKKMLFRLKADAERKVMKYVRGVWRFDV